MKKKWIVLFLVLVVLWFVPWTPVLHLGLVGYRPYGPDGKTRYWRITGPLASNDEWVNESDISPRCLAALVVSEDPNFFKHPGVDVGGMRLAWKRTQKYGGGKKVWGGSTITQQLVKNVFLSRDKSYLRKAREIIGALILDLTMNKEEQLIWYLNVVEFGPHIYGIKNAAKHFFNKTTKDLTLAQCTALITELPNPRVYSQYVNTRKPLGYDQRCSYVLARVSKDWRVSCE